MSLKANPPWRIQLFQGLRVYHGEQVVDRFDTRRSASLLAYLAFYPRRMHSREELTEMLWPEEDPDSTRLRLRQSLSIIRRLLDSPDSAKDGILISDRTYVRINSDVVTTDAVEFEALLQVAQQAENLAQRTEKLKQAITLYKGELLPGYYEDWVLLERRRLQDSYREALLLLVCALEENRDIGAALGHALCWLAATLRDRGALHLEQEALEEAEAVEIAKKSGLTSWEVTYLLWLGDMACDRSNRR